MDITTLSMEQLNTLTGSIYVINNSDLYRTQAKGIIIFSVTEKDGSNVTINIPKTFIPLDITRWASVEAIKTSTDFRTLVRKGAIVVVDASEAKMFLKRPEALAEMQRLEEAKVLITEKTAGKFKISVSDAPTTAAQPVDATEAAVNAELRTLVARFNKGDDDALLTAELRKLNGKLSLDDIFWAQQNVKALGTSFANALVDLEPVDAKKAGSFR